MVILRATTCVVGLIVAATVVFAQAHWDRQVCCDNRDPLAAISACTRLIEGGNLGDTDLGTAFYNRGVHLARVTEFERAIADFTRAIQITTLHPDAYNGRGNAYYSNGDIVDRGIEDYDRQIRIDPRHAHAYNSRGMAYAAKGQFDRAIEDFDRQIEIDVRHPDAFNNRANAYLGKGEPDRAIQDYDAQIAIIPGHR